MRTQRYQTGALPLGMLYLVLSLGFFVFLGFKFVPVYLDNAFIAGTLKSLDDESEDIAKYSNHEIRKTLERFFIVNNTPDEIQKKVRIHRKDGGVLIMIDYEKRIPIFYNIDAIMTFRNHFDSTRAVKCCHPADDAPDANFD